MSVACAALIALFGLAFPRFWAVLGGHLSGKFIAPLALLAAAICVFLELRFRLIERYCLPWADRPLKNLLVAAPAFVLGGWCDMSFFMFDSAGMLIGHSLFRSLSSLGSGLVLAVLALAVCRAVRAFDPARFAPGKQLLVLALVVNVMAGLYCAGTATVYTWDNAGYWTLAAQLAEAPFGWAQVQGVLQTVITADYNSLLALPISWVMRALGTGRGVFVFATVNLYLMPTLWGLCVLGKRTKWGGVLLALAFPMATYLALLGYVDVAAVGLAVWAFVCYTDGEAPPVSRGILAGVLLAGTFLLRRYFIFFALSFGIAALVSNLITNRRKWAGFAALFSSCGVCALFFTQSFLVDKLLSVKYGDLYAAYDLGLRSDIMLFCRYFGVVALTLAVVCGVFLLVCRKPLRGDAILALGQLVFCFFLLTRVQSHGQQHLLLYLPAAAMLLGAGTAERPVGTATPLCAAVVAACCFVSPMLPRVQPATSGEIRYATLLPSFSFASPRREDITQVLALRSFLDGLSQTEQKTAAVVSSSFLLNGETVSNVYRSLGLPEHGHHTQLIYMGTVDKRDAFSWNVLNADYLVVPSPVQTHLGEENQQIMVLLARAVLEGTGIGTAYERMETSFVLAGGMDVAVYERVRPVTQTEREWLSAELTRIYPDYAGLYAVPTE